MIQLQTYQPVFKEQIIDLILTIQQKEFNVPITIEDQPDLQVIPAFYQASNGNFWIATQQNSVVGTIALIDGGNGIGIIRKMFVKKEFRGKEYGIAQQLFDTLLVWSNQHNFVHIYLGTIERLYAARRFYDRNGFVAIPKQNLPIEFPIMAIDTHFYCLDLNTKRVDIIDYSPQYQADFKQLNLEWIQQYFVVEPHDIEQLDQPSKYILPNNGAIFLAKYNNQIMGTVAVINILDGSYEMAKMAVSPQVQGLGIGRLLGNKVIEFAREAGIKRVWLESNRKLTPALTLYRSLGFKEVSIDYTPYSRADIRMEIAL